MSSDLGFELPPPAKLTKTRVLAIALLVLATLVTLFLVRWLPRRNHAKALAASTDVQARQTSRVQVAVPKLKASDQALSLPGSIQALEETVVYARASGYVRRWLVDLGARVEEGTLLADIDTPEVDQQLDQARAQLGQAEAQLVQAKANHAFSLVTLARYKVLAPQGVASQQDLDQKDAQAKVDEANVVAAKAMVSSQEANVRRFVQLKSFARVASPFAGTVTARMVERGALVSPSTPLFRVSANDPVRVLVQVPQDLAPTVRVDLPAEITVREYGGRVFKGMVAHAAGALEPTSRTMSTEVRVPNPKGELLSGMYTQVAITLPSPHRTFELPPTALYTDAQGVRVATVGANDKIHMVPIVIERDTGATIEVSAGLTGDERVVRIANAEIVEGKPVEVAP
ncbi:MAG: putative Co/Zn/Cd efflux system rane fusion protein [Myxococcaceae bacterium]|nr:putative Co/Zn/Cd efflux system rane fusion protein [Myxococcaceae bacterium]